MKVERKEKIEETPLLYDLTTLQKDANTKYGFTAEQTLDITQKLYEKKLVTYPRTGSRYIPDPGRCLCGNTETAGFHRQTLTMERQNPAKAGAYPKKC